MDIDENCDNDKTLSICNIDPTNHRGICPEGWRIPNKSDYDNLFDVAGNDAEKVFHNLAAIDNFLEFKINGINVVWHSIIPNTTTDNFGFSALASGTLFRTGTAGSGMESSFLMWLNAPDEKEKRNSYTMLFMKDMSAYIFYSMRSTDYLIPIRCVKDLR
jgi:uncharacterized protein (TIGR02145 family)